MKIVILLLLGLASLVTSVPQSRFDSRHQPSRADDPSDTAEAADVAKHPTQTGRGKTSDADLDAAGPDAGVEDDKKEDTPAKPVLDDGEKQTATGLDAAKERRRLANIRKRLVKPSNEEGEESAVTISPDNTHPAAPALGHRRPGAGQQDSNDEQAAHPTTGLRRAGAAQQVSNDQESTPAKDEGSQNPPASNLRKRFHSTSSSSSSVSDASHGNKEDTATGTEVDSSDQPQKVTTFEKRRPALRRQQASTPAPIDDQSQDESSDAGSSTHLKATDSTNPAEKQVPAAGAPTAGSMKERLERYRQRQAERQGASSQTGAGNGRTDAQKSVAQSDATAGSDATSESDATAESDAAAGSDVAAVSGATADSPSSGLVSQNSGVNRSSA